MPSFHTQVSHRLGRERATERLKEFLEKVRLTYKHQVSRLDESVGIWPAAVIADDAQAERVTFVNSAFLRQGHADGER